MSLRGFSSFGPSWVLEEEDEDSNPPLLSVRRLGSPINLQSKDAIHSNDLLRRPLEIYYTECRDSVLENTGSTVRILLPTACDLTGGPLPDGSIYRLREILFHWGRDNRQGSEHTVNGHAFPMEIQFVHWNATHYPCYEDALGQKNGVAIIGLFVQEENKVIGALFNPESLLPHPTLRDFWTYKGSLTWPPYSEDVDWILMRYPMTVSPLQVEDFRQLLTYKKGEIVPNGRDEFLVDNFRTVQSLQGREIRSSFE